MSLWISRDCDEYDQSVLGMGKLVRLGNGMRWGMPKMPYSWISFMQLRALQTGFGSSLMNALSLMVMMPRRPSFNRSIQPFELEGDFARKSPITVANLFLALFLYKIIIPA